MFPASFTWRADIGVDSICIGDIVVWSYHEDHTDECMNQDFCLKRLREQSKITSKL